MRLPSLKSRKVTHDPKLLLTKLFGCIAKDLRLEGNKEVRTAQSLLASGKYISFLSITGSWGTQQYTSAEEHSAWNQLACLLKKFPFEDPRIDREGAALKKFKAAEHKCKRINARFRARRLRNVFLRPHDTMLDRARRVILKVLGDEPNLDSILGLCDFGPGASIGVHGSATHSAAKLEGRWTVTPTCAPYALRALRLNAQIWECLSDTPFICFDPAWFQERVESRFEYVCNNKIVCVPKTALVDRTIAIEPTLNGYVQKGVDVWMRQRLLRVLGIDLSDQTKNQTLARKGSEGGFNPFSTIDLSMASDTISKEIVKELLPREWFNFLMRIRSPEYELNGESFSYEKFSSMGNGFSFPLETLIFASIVAACYEETGDSEFAVYGDDIIVRQRSALLVIELLKYCGFSTNVDKTFIHGPFRESCGADFFEGKSVRPYYIDETPRNWDDIYKWLNGIRGKHGRCTAWLYLFGILPDEWKFTRPYVGSDDSISVDLDEHMCSPFASFDRKIQNWRYPRVISKAVSDLRPFRVGSQMYGLLRGAASDGDTPQFALRRKTRTRLAYSS